MSIPDLVIRPAKEQDVPALEALIESSARSLSQGFYSEVQTDAAIRTMFGVDSTLIADGTYFMAEVDGELLGCGGWSRHAKLCGGDQRSGCGSAPETSGACASTPKPAANLEGARAIGIMAQRLTNNPSRDEDATLGRLDVGGDDLLDPTTDPARIRAFFVAPSAARKGVGKRLFEECVTAAKAAGFSSLELMATLPGVPFYAVLGFSEVEKIVDTTADGIEIPFVRMRRAI